MNVLARVTFTPEDLLSIPEAKGCELVDGLLVERNMGAESTWITTRLARYLDVFCDANRLGWVFTGEAGYLCFPFAPTLVRKPDASFVRRGRLPGGLPPTGHILLPPDLAVEVVSPNDLYYEVEREIHEYLRAGVPLVWVINPPTQVVRIHRPGGSLTDLEGQQELTGENVLPGFRCRVADLFPQPEGTQPPAGTTNGATPSPP